MKVALQFICKREAPKYVWGDVQMFSSCVCGDRIRRNKAWSGPNPNKVVFVPKPNQTICTAFAQQIHFLQTGSFQTYAKPWGSLNEPQKCAQEVV